MGFLLAKPCATGSVLNNIALAEFDRQAKTVTATAKGARRLVGADQAAQGAEAEALAYT